MMRSLILASLMLFGSSFSYAIDINQIGMASITFAALLTRIEHYYPTGDVEYQPAMICEMLTDLDCINTIRSNELDLKANQWECISTKDGTSCHHVEPGKIKYYYESDDFNMYIYCIDEKDWEKSLEKKFSEVNK